MPYYKEFSEQIDTALDQWKSILAYSSRPYDDLFETFQSFIEVISSYVHRANLDPSELSDEYADYLILDIEDQLNEALFLTDDLYGRCFGAANNNEYLLPHVQGLHQSTPPKV